MKPPTVSIRALRPRVLLSGMLALLTLLAGCERNTFEMKIDDVFYLENAGRVVAVGVITRGTVRRGDRLMVYDGFRYQPVTVERLENPDKRITEATVGEKVGLRLRGVAKGQVRSGQTIMD